MRVHGAVHQANVLGKEAVVKEGLGGARDDQGLIVVIEAIAPLQGVQALFRVGEKAQVSL